MRTRTGRLLAGLLAAAAVICALAATAGASGYKLVTLPKYGGEPGVWVSDQGVMYDTSPSLGAQAYRSNDGGKHWVQTAIADKASGDTCVATDQSGAVYLCNLAGSKSVHPLEADVFKSVNQGHTWMYGNNADNMGANICGTSCQPFGVDRQWTDAYIPKGKTTNQALVVLAYHDFYGPSHIWYNISTDGAKTFGQSENLFAHANPSETALWSLANSDCNTVPTGARIVKSGKHAGRIYLSWISSDPKSVLTGCNISMAQDFHNIWVAWSDDKGATWNIQLAYDAGQGHDLSTPFASMSLDTQGNPYISFDTPAPSESAPTCGAESTLGTVQSDPSCSYHTWVVWSKDGGQTWDGGGGMFTGTAATPYEVDSAKKPQTDVFTTIAAGNPGHVAVSWLRTNEIDPTDGLKFDPGGCAGSTAPAVPPNYPAACKWQLFAAQSTNLTQPPNKATWKIEQLTTTPMHVGDICNLGIACIPSLSNRNLLDFNSEALDPTTGCVHIAYADDNKVNKLRVANQVSGPSIAGGRCRPRSASVPTHHRKKHHHHKRKHRNPGFTG
jgi:hypothetical protein